MNVQHYKNIILPLLSESFDEREAGNLFKYVLEDYFNKRYFDVKDIHLSDQELEELNFIYEKIANQYPVQYIFQKAHFYGLEFYVDEHVLIPRPETEELVQWILEDNKENKELSVLDIGTGSGCIAIAIKKNKPDWKVSGSDISEEALKVARQNSINNGTDVTFFQDNVLHLSANFQPTSFNCIVSNPPYIPYSEADKMSASTRSFEPSIALFVDDQDPFIYYIKIADFALQHLVPGGSLYFETNEFNAQQVKEILENKGFKEVLVKKDMSAKDRMIRAIR